MKPPGLFVGARHDASQESLLWAGSDDRDACIVTVAGPRRAGAAAPA